MRANPKASTRRRIGYLISAGAIAALVYWVDWGQVTAAFRAAAPAPLGAAAVLMLSFYLLCALRWRTLLCDDDTLPLGAVFGALMTGYLANLVFPLRPGDLLRALLIDRRYAYGKLKALASVGLDRIFDLGGLCAFGLIALTQVPDAFIARLGDALGTTLALIAAVCAALVIILIIGGRAGRAGPGKARGGRLGAGIRHARAALRELAGDSRRRRPRLLKAAALSLAAWGCFVAAMIACVSAFSPATTYGAGLVLTVVTNLGAAIPSSPAGVGVYHGLAVMTLVACGLPAADALAIAIVSHALASAIQAGLGAGALAWGGGWRRLQEARAVHADEAERQAVRKQHQQGST